MVFFIKKVLALSFLKGGDNIDIVCANSAYWQVQIAPEDRKKTAFLKKHGLYEFTRMEIGLCNVSATF